MKKYLYKNKEYLSLNVLRKAANLSFSNAISEQALSELGIDVIDAAYMPPEINADDLRQSKINELIAQCDALLYEKLSCYPENEKATFSQQVAEAKAVLAGAEPAIFPLVAALALAREIPISDLAVRILQHHEEYSRFAGKIIGQTQRCKELLVNAETVDAIQKIDLILQGLPDESL